MDCLEEAEVLAVVEGRLVGGPRRRIEHHLDECRACVELVTEARLALASGSSPTVDVAAELRRSDALDRYQLGPELARGGMGRIVAARDRRLDREVAIKIALGSSPELAARFVREVALTSRLEHPAIVPVHDAGVLDDGTPFYVMRLVGRASFDQIVSRAEDVAARLALVPHVLAIADAVAYVHSQGVLHRDLKPHNILIGEFGETVLIDWGLARTLDEHEPRAAAVVTPSVDLATVAGAVVGTPAYMAPEQLAGGAVDRRADVYGLGATLYHTLAGQPPHAADRTAADVARPLDDVAPGIPRELAAIVARAMASAPADRYASAVELAADLRRFETGQLVGAYRYSWGRRVARAVSRHRAALAVATVSLVAIVALTVTGLSRIVDERGRAEQARVQAEEQRDAAQRLVGFVLGELRDELGHLGHLELLARTSGAVLAYYGSLDSTAQVAAVQRAAAARTLGDARSAAGALDEALDAYRAGLADLEGATTDEAALLRCDLELMRGDVLHDLGRGEDLEVAYRRADELARAGLRRQPGSAAWQLRMLEATVRAIAMAARRGEDAVADQLAADARALAAPLRRDDPGGAACAAMLIGETLVNGTAINRNDWTSAGPSAERALDAARELARRHPSSVKSLYGLARAWDRVGMVLMQRGDLAGAEAAFVASQASAATLVAREPAHAMYRFTLQEAIASQGRIALARGDRVAARRLFTSSRDQCRELVALEPRHVDLIVALAESELDLGNLARGEGQPGELGLADARDAYRRAIEGYERAQALAPGEASLGRGLGLAWFRLSLVETQDGDPAAAREAIARSVELARAALGRAGSSGAELELARALVVQAALQPASRAAILAEAQQVAAPLRAGAAADPELRAFLDVLDSDTRQARGHR